MYIYYHILTVWQNSWCLGVCLNECMTAPLTSSGPKSQQSLFRARAVQIKHRVKQIMQFFDTDVAVLFNININLNMLLMCINLFSTSLICVSVTARHQSSPLWCTNGSSNGSKGIIQINLLQQTKKTSLICSYIIRWNTRLKTRASEVHLNIF